MTISRDATPGSDSPAFPDLEDETPTTDELLEEEPENADVAHDLGVGDLQLDLLEDEVV